MGLGSTAKKLQSLADVAEKLVEQFNALRKRVITLESTAQETNDRIERLESELSHQQALLEAVAAEHGIDPEEYAPDGTESTDDD